MEIIAELLILLIAARAFGEGAERLGQPASVGELLAGVILALIIVATGASVPILSGLPDSGVLDDIANLGIFFLMLQAGVAFEPRELARATRRAVLVAVGGVAVPLAAGVAFGWLILPDSDMRGVQALFIGVVLSITAVPVAVRMLDEAGLLHHPIGRTVVAAAIFDDVLGLVLLAVVSGILANHSLPGLDSILLLAAKVAAFFAVTIIAGVHVYPRIGRALRTMQAASLEFSAMVVVAMAYGLLAEILGLHWILGAFMAGLYFEPSRVGRRAYLEIKLILVAITGAVLGPLFFVVIGLQVDPAAPLQIPGILILLIVVACVSKILGAGLAARQSGLGARDAVAVGAIMNARGATGLVVISIANEAGLFAAAGPDDAVGAYLYSALVLMAVVTTLVGPVVLRVLDYRSVSDYSIRRRD